jgi:hypothetical protein
MSVYIQKTNKSTALATIEVDATAAAAGLASTKHAKAKRHARGAGAVGLASAKTNTQAFLGITGRQILISESLKVRGQDETRSGHFFGLFNAPFCHLGGNLEKFESKI